MKKKLLLVALISLLVLSGCQLAKNVEEKSITKLTLAGSTSMEKLCEAMKESFEKDNPQISVSVEYTGSGAGLESLAKGSVDIGNASRNLKDKEKEKGLVENVVAIDGIAVITSKNNSVKNISKEQLKQIYLGQINNWSQLGGEEEAIIVLGREAGSGTRDAFEELLKVKDQCKYAQELDSTGGVLAKVTSTSGAIGYISLDVLNDSVLGLKIDNVEASAKEILAGNYSLQRSFVMATRGEIATQNSAIKAWFDYLASAKGQEIIAKVGLIAKK